MNRFVAAISIAAQLVGLVAIYWMLFEFFTLPEDLLREFTADNETTQQYLAETFASWQPWPFVGVVGAVLAWLLIRNGRCHEKWFLTASLVMACMWLPLVPVGTVLGALVLIARARAVRNPSDDPIDG